MTPFHLEVGQGHSMRGVTFGHPHGRPVLFLHGGPGSGCNAGQQALFDPARDFAIFPDQRGAGSSLPRRARSDNTTAHLIADLELLRAHLGIERWDLVGGSWGATLALAYAQSYPARIRAMALRAVFLGTRAELDWAFGTALATFHPRLHKAFLQLLTPEERADPLPAYWARILHPDPEIHASAAWAWHDVERALSQVPAPYDALPLHEAGAPLPATPFMEAHYFAQDCFLGPDQLLRDIGRLQGIPAILIQARHDLLCPPSTTARLAALWPSAKLVMVEGAGHSLGHIAVFDTLRQAISDLA